MSATNDQGQLQASKLTPMQLLSAIRSLARSLSNGRYAESDIPDILVPPTVADVLKEKGPPGIKRAFWDKLRDLDAGYWAIFKLHLSQLQKDDVITKKDADILVKLSPKF